jgi:hypothetical protein
MPTPPRPQPTALRIELREVSPLIWRRVLVSNQWTLTSLHKWLQWIMGWNDTHAHEFQVGESIVAPDWWIYEVENDFADVEYRDERRVSVANVVAEVGARGEFEYRYDMGDGWRLAAAHRCRDTTRRHDRRLSNTAMPRWRERRTAG